MECRKKRYLPVSCMRDKLRRGSCGAVKQFECVIRFRKGEIDLEKRQEAALQYAKEQIKKSKIFPFVRELILFGSCARNEENYKSDVDLLLVLDPAVKTLERYSGSIHLLKSLISTDELNDAETDLKVVIGDDWKTNTSTFYRHIREEGILLWH